MNYNLKCFSKLLFFTLLNLNMFCAEVNKFVPSANSAFKKVTNTKDQLFVELTKIAASGDLKLFFDFIGKNPKLNLYLDGIKAAILSFTKDKLEFIQYVWQSIINNIEFNDPINYLTILISFVYENIHDQDNKFFLIKFFLENLIHFNYDFENKNILHYLAIHGKCEIMKYLNEKFPELNLISSANVKDKFRNTPLFYASVYLNLECVQYLVNELKADVKLTIGTNTNLLNFINNSVVMDKSDIPAAKQIVKFLQDSLIKQTTSNECKTNSSEDVKETKCPVCWQELNKENIIILRNCCANAICRDCVAKLGNNAFRCPVCRGNAGGLSDEALC